MIDKISLVFRYFELIYIIMKYKSLTHKDKTHRNDLKITQILSDLNFDWLIDAEIENAEIEIKNDTLIWKSGTWYSGTWFYGIWQKGNFLSGVFLNGIWEEGTFKGEFRSGIGNPNNVG